MPIFKFMYPYIVIFGKTFGSYGIMLVLAVAVAVIGARKKAKAFNFDFNDIIIIGGGVGLGGVFGSTLLYMLVTFPIPVLIQKILKGDFSGLGGFVFYGGLIGGILGAIITVKLLKVEVAVAEKIIIPYIPLAHAVGRVGCLLAGCCHGMEYDGPLAVYYPNSVLGVPPTQGYFPTQILEGILNIGIMFVLLYLSKKVRYKYDLLFSYLLMYAVVRFIVEFFRGDKIRGIFNSLSSSQWISIGLFVIAIIGIFLNVIIHKKRKS